MQSGSNEYRKKKEIHFYSKRKMNKERIRNKNKKRKREIQLWNKIKNEWKKDYEIKLNERKRRERKTMK